MSSVIGRAADRGVGVAAHSERDPILAVRALLTARGVWPSKTFSTFNHQDGYVEAADWRFEWRFRGAVGRQLATGPLRALSFGFRFSANNVGVVHRERTDGCDDEHRFQAPLWGTALNSIHV